MEIQIKRGKERNIPTLKDGQQAFATDTKRLYIGNNGENVNVTGVKEAATSSSNGLMSAADKGKLDSIAANANNYIHPTTDGNKHIPAGGSSGQILAYKESGTAQWTDNDANTLNGKNAAAFVEQDSNGNVAINGDISVYGNMRLKGEDNYGNIINLGDGDYVHVAEPGDDTLELKGTRIRFCNGNIEVMKLEDYKLYLNGLEVVGSEVSAEQAAVLRAEQEEQNLDRDELLLDQQLLLLNMDLKASE